MRLRSSLRRLAILSLVAATLSSAGPAAASDRSFVVPDMPGGGFRTSMSTMLDRRFYSVERQRYDFSCGSAALATLLHYHYGVRADEQTTFNGMWDKGDQAQIRKLGFSLLDMKRYLQSVGLQTQGFRVTLDQIANTGVPGIALTVTRGYRHFVVIKGVSPQGVLIGDPSRGLLRMDRAEFEKVWDGLFFVITDARAAGQRSFNRPAQWGAVGNTPLGGTLSRPGDLDPLRIATPQLLFGEF